MSVILYSTHCPKCNVLKKKLDQHQINYDVVTDIDAIQDISNKTGIKTIPILEINNKFMDFKSAIDWMDGK